MVGAGGSLKKTGVFGRLLRRQAQLDPAGREGSAPGSRGLLSLLPNNKGIEDLRTLPHPIQALIQSPIKKG